MVDTAKLTGIYYAGEFQEIAYEEFGGFSERILSGFLMFIFPCTACEPFVSLLLVSVSNKIMRQIRCQFMLSKNSCRLWKLGSKFVRFHFARQIDFVTYISTLVGILLIKVP